MPRWRVYLLRCGDGSLYAGVTTRPWRRLTEHRAGRGARYTRAHLPVDIAWVSTPMDRSAALRLEIRLKALRHREKLLLLTPGTARRILLRRLRAVGDLAAPRDDEPS